MKYARQHGLTKRESEIADGLAQGLTNKQIAAKLGISPFTIRDALSSVFRKLEVKNRLEAALVLIRNSTPSPLHLSDSALNRELLESSWSAKHAPLVQHFEKRKDAMRNIQVSELMELPRSRFETVEATTASRKSQIVEMTANEIDSVSGGDAYADGLMCVGGFVGYLASDGLLALTGWGLAAMGACYAWYQDF